MCENCTDIQNVFKHPPWYFTAFYIKLCEELEDKDEPLPSSIRAIVGGTGVYEGRIRELWHAFRRNPTEVSAAEFIEAVKEVAEELWPEVMQQVLDIAELTGVQDDMLQEELTKHKGYLDHHLFPDIIKGMTNLDGLEYRAIFLYAGALWSFGMLATVLFDGVNVRDFADLFIFIGPADEATCVGPGGCLQHVNQIYTVAQILAEDLIPGHFICMMACRHILLPIASPLPEPDKKPEEPVAQSDIQMIYGWKGGPGSGHHGHAGRPGQVGGSAPGTGGVAASVAGERIPRAPVATTEDVLRQHERDIIGLKYEAAVVVDDSGNVIFEKKGAKDYVAFTPAESRKLRGKTLTHNHPPGESFSRADVETMFDLEMSEIRVVGQLGGDKYLYRMRPDDIIRALASGQNEQYFTEIVRTTDIDVRRDFTGRVRSGSMTIVDAGKEHWHVVWTRVEDLYKGKGSLGYSREVIP